MLLITGRLPNLNDFIKAQNTHRIKGAQLKKENTYLVEMLARQQRIEPVEGQICLRVKFYEPNMKRDIDNVASFAIKCILDGLQNADVIKNDNWRVVRKIEYEFEIDKLNPRIEVELIPID